MTRRAFASFFMGGFECSAHRRGDGRRLDLIESSGHFASHAADYRQLTELGIRTVRDGLRWHLIEKQGGRYDWSSFLPMLRAARANGTEVIWDLCHYGWPDHLDIWRPAFVDSFARFARKAAELIRDEGIGAPAFCPVNEISFWAWAGGDMARINPNCHGRGGELKAQLVRATIAAVDALLSVDPTARIVYSEPAVHVAADPGRPEDRDRAEAYRQSQFEAWDMIAGTQRPELGGNPRYLDRLGLNFYPDNQWYLDGGIIPFGHHDYRPLRAILAEAFRRYRRPLLITETGAEGTARAAWLHYVGEEVEASLQDGVPVEGICLYPVLEYLGWDNDRRCPVGLLGAVSESGRRPVYEPLAAELRRQSGIAAGIAKIAPARRAV
jgi:beta-glucosidase/6-phospho-beta-glucosidase/beta-galactosidase